MICNTNDQHTFTINKLEEVINHYQLEIEEYSTSLARLLDHLKPHLEYLHIEPSRFTNYTADKIKKLNGNITAPNKYKRNLYDLRRLLIEYYTIRYKYEERLEKVKFYNTLLSKVRSPRIYSKIIRKFNSEIVKRTIESGRYAFSLGLSTIYIRMRKVNEKSSRTNSQIDWEATDALKKELLAKGETLYSKDKNPNGKKYIVFYDNTYDFWWGWVKAPCRFTNKVFYQFRPSSFNNTHRIPKESHLYNPSRQRVDFIPKCKSKDDILNCEYIGSVQKLLWTMIFDKLHYVIYRKNLTEYE